MPPVRAESHERNLERNSDSTWCEIGAGGHSRSAVQSETTVMVSCLALQ